MKLYDWFILVLFLCNYSLLSCFLFIHVNKEFVVLVIDNAVSIIDSHTFDDHQCTIIFEKNNNKTVLFEDNAFSEGKTNTQSK